MGYLGEGFRLIRQPGLRLFVVMPLILNVLVFAVLIWLLGEGYAAMVDAAMGWLPDWEWLQVLDWVFWILYGLVILLLLAYGFVMLANLIGSPFYGYLSELAEKAIAGETLTPDDGWLQIVKDIPRALYREVRKILYYLPRALVLFVLGLIPVVNLVAAVLWFLFNSWMMVLQYVDYPADNHRVSFDGLLRCLSRQRLTALGFGLPVALLAMVPLVNLVLVPAAVCGATAYWVREMPSGPDYQAGN
ncbi:MAG: sulfate transporter CysZ [Pseudomonadota bacterium]